MKPFKVIKQLDSNDCGIAAIAMLMNYYGTSLDSYGLSESYPHLNGISLQQILDILTQYNFNAKAIKLKKEDIMSSYTLPAIVLMEEDGVNHYIIIYKIIHKKIFVADSLKGKYKLNEEEFIQNFSGIMILAVPTIESKIIKDSMKSLWGFFKALILPQKKLILIIILASLLITTGGILGSTFSKIIMDEIIPYELINKLLYTVIFFSFLIIMQSLLNAFRQHITLYLERKIDIPVSLGYFDHILNLPMNFFGSKRIGDILTRFQDSGTIKEIVSTLSVTLILDISLAIASTIILININWKLYMILILQLIINIVVIYLFKKPYEKLNYDLMKLNSGLNSFLIESFQNIEVIKSYQNENNTIFSLEKKSVELLNRGFEGGKLQNFQSTISSIFGGIFPLVLYGMGTLFIINREMSIGDLLFFQTLSVYFMQPVESLSTLQLTFQEAKIAIHRLNELMKIDREDVVENKIKPNLNGDLELKDISFNYNERKTILKHLNLEIEKGDKVGIIGKSGSGKTTLVKLLLGFIKPKSGTVTLNGFNVNDIDTKYIRTKVRYVSQNINIFTGSIFENITFGSEKKTLLEVNNVCKLSGLTEMINNLPDKINTIIKENGINLSVGEKQRISIARALLNGGDIFIFDECTSNLDEDNENLFKDIIQNHLKDKTIIVISHRESTLTICSKIYRIQNGELEKIKDTSIHSKKASMNEEDKIIYEEN